MISIIVPLYNEMENVVELSRRLLAAAPAWKEPFEVVLVDDGSKDGTIDWCRKTALADSRFRLLSLSRNFGHQAAIFAGLDHAKGDSVVILHSDLQDPPETIHLLLDKLREGYDVAIGVRTKRKESLFLRAVYFISYRVWTALLTDVDALRDAGDFCAMNRNVVQAMNALPEKMRFFRGLRTWVGFRQIGVPYAREKRHAGEPKVSWADLYNLAKGAIIDFSEKPLQILFALGVIAIVASGVLTVTLFTGYGPSHGAFSLFTAAMLLFGTAFQLLGLGVVALYVGRVLREVKGRPGYVIREIVESKNTDDTNDT